MTEPVSEDQIDAYVDGQLPIAQRMAVEDYLASHPEAAARVMADLRLRDALRLLQGDTTTRVATARVDSLARRLQRRLSWAANFRTLVNGAVAAAYIGLGWWCSTQLWPSAISEGQASPSIPAFVEEAGRAHHVSTLRLDMPSQDEDPDYDAEEIRAKTAITVPVMPDGWTVLDVQVFPSKSGPSLEMVVAIPRIGRLSIFTVRSPASGWSEPRRAVLGPLNSVWWYDGDVAHALTGDLPPAQLETLAGELR